MLSVSRICQNSLVFSQIRTYVGFSSRNFVRTSPVKRYSTLVRTPQPPENSFKISNFLRSSGTIASAIRSNSNASNKGRKTVGYWLLTCGGMVFVAVVLGGVTRLTESGLSMVTWKLLGENMPRTEEEWTAEFERYKQYPEFKIKNREMTLKEFKFIWHMEYGHRQWGRAIGAFFIIPAAYFWARGRFTPALKKRVLAFGTLIGAQGLMGWYMVKSGLEDRFHGQNDVPRVSQYRLAAHLSLAFILYTLFLWSALDVLIPAQTIAIAGRTAIQASRKFRILAHSAKGLVFLTAVSAPGFAGRVILSIITALRPHWAGRTAIQASRKFRILAHSAKGLVFLTAVSGAFVAGLDAGLVYNSFPKMADKWIPDDILALSPKLANFTENPTTVQFDHRILGTTTLGVITAVWLLSRKRILPPRAYKAAAVFGWLGYLQVALGITTLLTYVPTNIAAMHQTGSLALLSSAVWLTHELKRLPK